MSRGVGGCSVQGCRVKMGVRCEVKSRIWGYRVWGGEEVSSPCSSVSERV